LLHDCSKGVCHSCPPNKALSENIIPQLPYAVHRFLPRNQMGI
jgi:hypothetical protein